MNSILLLPLERGPISNIPKDILPSIHFSLAGPPNESSRYADSCSRCLPVLCLRCDWSDGLRLEKLRVRTRSSLLSA